MDVSACPHTPGESVDAGPAPSLRPGVLRYRGFRRAQGPPCRHLEVPAGAVSLLLLTEGELLLGPPDTPGPLAAHTAVACGMRTSGLAVEHRGPVAGVEVTLTPWCAYTLFGGHPLARLGRGPLDLAELIGPRAAALRERLAEASGPPARFAVLDRTLAELLTAGPPPAPPVVRAWRGLHASAGGAPIPQLAHEVGWCQSQLERRFREQVGLTPKGCARVIRLRNALRLLRGGLPGAELAAAAGFHDQSHLSREFKSMTGTTLGRYLAAAGS
ncbi:helix-turn-helix domain-containing protein [Streptomyces sp. NPDC048270]|uniref:helix-turn-helix domain-containing protein n=1 Tax=Streptomyces sp. NPDC048270 TaxID=3154615 RepID=UPI0033FB33F1